MTKYSADLKASCRLETIEKTPTRWQEEKKSINKGSLNRLKTIVGNSCSSFIDQEKRHKVSKLRLKSCTDNRNIIYKAPFKLHSHQKVKLSWKWCRIWYEWHFVWIQELTPLLRQLNFWCECGDKLSLLTLFDKGGGGAGWSPKNVLITVPKRLGRGSWNLVTFTINLFSIEKSYFWFPRLCSIAMATSLLGGTRGFLKLSLHMFPYNKI